jgi:hypothetical protein
MQAHTQNRTTSNETRVQVKNLQQKFPQEELIWLGTLHHICPGQFLYQ